MNGRMAAVLVVAATTLAGCGSGSDADDGSVAQRDRSPDGAEAAPAAIECGTQYRPDAEQLTGAEEPVLRVELTSDAAVATGTLDFPAMTLSVRYVGDAPEGASVDVLVVSSDGESLSRSLYQVGEPPLQQIDFAGGHGFTGLHYVDHGPAQLQVWCAAVDR